MPKCKQCPRQCAGSSSPYPLPHHWPFFGHLFLCHTSQCATASLHANKSCPTQFIPLSCHFPVKFNFPPSFPSFPHQNSFSSIQICSAEKGQGYIPFKGHNSWLFPSQLMGAEFSAEKQQQKTGKQERKFGYLTTHTKRQKKYSSIVDTAQGGIEVAKKSQIKIVEKRQHFNQHRNLTVRIRIMNSPFRGLRRAAASTGSPISCCSSCSASGTAISIPAFPRTHSTVMVIPGAKRPNIPPSSANTTYVSPSSSGWTPSTPRPLLLDEDDQNNNVNEQLLLHFPNLPPGVTNNNEGEPVPTIMTTTEKQSLVSQYGFQTHRPRPPLNRAIPPIPESRSNESIQSTHSRRQSGGIQHQTVQMIDENNPIDEPIHKEVIIRPDSMLIESTISEIENNEGGKGRMEKASKLPKFVRRKDKSRKENESSENINKEPKSPLLSVAHSVKNRFNRLTHGKSTKTEIELPMSRSLEIQRQGSRIPQIAEPMPKSKSMEEQRELPKRMPVTTLIPSPSRRLPPDEELEEERRQKEMIKQVQFAPLPFEEEKLPELSRKAELPFCLWTPEKRIPPILPEEEFKKIDEREEKLEVEKEEIKEMRPLTPPILPPPASPPSGGHRSPPKVLSLLRKSPQSFPPLGSLNSHSETVIRSTKSSVSFGAADIQKNQKELENQNEKEGKRRVFTTRSLRMVANRVYEGSPLVKRRGRSESREREKPQKIEPLIGSARLFRKSNSIPEDDEQQKANKTRNVEKSSGAVKLRSVQSVKTVHNLRSPAPLAVSESSRVENSPAVEQCPPWEMPSTLATTTTNNRENGKGISKRGFLFGATARLCRKDKEEQKKEAKEKRENNKSKVKAAPPLTSSKIPQSTSRPTLAQLLASPVPRKKPNQTEPISKKDKGLIDDEIKDQPMLISTTTLGADFRLIDEPSSSSIHSHSHGPVNAHITPTSSAPSSELLIAEQQPNTDEISVHMVQNKMQTGLNLAETSRKRNAPKQVETAKMKAIGKEQCMATISTSSNAPGSKTKRSTDIKEEEMPWADESVKSEDGASMMPNVLISEFRSDLTELRDSVRRDLEELETLRLQNAILKEQLAERDKIIEQLQKQLRGEI